MIDPTFDPFTIDDLAQVLAQSMEYAGDTSDTAPERQPDAALELGRALRRHLTHLFDGVWRTITEHYGAPDWTRRLRDAQLGYVRSIGDVPDDIASKVDAALHGTSHADLVFHVAAAVWIAEVRPAVIERKSPAILVDAARALAVDGAEVVGDVLIDSAGSILALVPGDILLGRVPSRGTDADLISKATFDRALWWLYLAGHGFAIDSARDIGNGWIEIPGGFRGLAASIGATSKQAETEVRRVLDLLYDMSIDLEFGRFRLVEAYSHPSTARGRSRGPSVPGAQLRIKVGDICRPMFAEKFVPDGWSKNIMPMLSPAPLESLPSSLHRKARVLDAQARCDLRDQIGSALTTSGVVIGVELDWDAVATRCGFPHAWLSTVLGDWKRCGRWEEVRPRRWFIGTGEPAGREQSIRSARMVLGRSIGGKRSVEAKRKRFERGLPHNSPATSPQLPANLPTTSTPLASNHAHLRHPDLNATERSVVGPLPSALAGRPVPADQGGGE